MALPLLDSPHETQPSGDGHILERVILTSAAQVRGQEIRASMNLGFENHRSLLGAVNFTTKLRKLEYSRARLLISACRSRMLVSAFGNVPK
jgi:hypothetical protein